MMRRRWCWCPCRGSIKDKAKTQPDDGNDTDSKAPDEATTVLQRRRRRRLPLQQQEATPKISPSISTTTTTRPTMRTTEKIKQTGISLEEMCHFVELEKKKEKEASPILDNLSSDLPAQRASPNQDLHTNFPQHRQQKHNGGITICTPTTSMMSVVKVNIAEKSLNEIYDASELTMEEDEDNDWRQELWTQPKPLRFRRSQQSLLLLNKETPPLLPTNSNPSNHAYDPDFPLVLDKSDATQESFVAPVEETIEFSMVFRYKDEDGSSSFTTLPTLDESHTSWHSSSYESTTTGADEDVEDFIMGKEETMAMDGPSWLQPFGY
ncbi:hypothetical protein ACA910_006761 [Epithemia clementina (nom. ined.)]